MNKKLALAVLAAAVLGVAFTVGGRGSGNDWGNDRLCPPSLDRIAQATGAWLFVVDFGNGPFEGEMQFFADGNVVVNNTVLNEGNNHVTTALGAWKRTGLRTIAMTALCRIVNPSGELLSYEKVVAELTSEGNVLSGDAAGLIYLPNQDPLDPEVTPVQVLTGPATGRRICVERLEN